LFKGHFFDEAKYRIIRKDGEVRWNVSSWKIVYDGGGEKIGIQGRQQDITERKEAEEQVKASLKEKETLLQKIQLNEQNMASVLNNTQDLVVRIDKNFRHIYANPALYKANGLSPERYIGKTNEEIEFPEDLHSFWREKHEKVFKTGNAEAFEFAFSTIDKGNRLFQAIVTPEFDNNRQVKTIVSFMRDITEQKQAEEQIKANLKEKETLLHEIHHRVKNNMTVISSLLSLQRNNVDNKEAEAAMQDSQNRVQSMSMIHETLYRSDNFATIDLKTYLSELGRTIFQNYSISNKVQFKVEAENIMIGAKQASPVGLIVNELIANCLKYAFPNDREGEILLELKTNKENGVELSVSDNGIGLPESFDWRKSPSLGLKLVRSLTEDQLGGSIDMESKNGTKFTIKFNIET
jgi:PAS domain S-box-containing protein